VVSSTTPEDGSSGLEPTETETVSFGEALDCASVVAGSVTLSENGTSIAGAATCKGDTIRFSPTAELPTRATLTATVGTGVTDAAGNALASAYRWSFATRPWTQRLGTAAIDTGQAVAVDAAGSVFVVGSTFGSPDGSTRWIRQFGSAADDFIWSIAADGGLAWLRQWGSAADDCAYGTTLGAGGQVISAGYTSGALDGLANLGESDVIVVRHAADGTPR
jgi:hypothetical protein